jgi:hypothetical protein
VWKGIAMKSKSVNRKKLLNSIIEALKHSDIYGTINYRKQSESKIKQFVYPVLLTKISKLYETTHDVTPEHAMKKAKKCLLWEGNVNTTISNNMFMGTQHRPDLVVDMDDVKIAIEIKKGDNGATIREGLGQSLVYSNIFDFTIVLFIDTSKDKRIANGCTSNEEKRFIDELWRKHNIRFEVV